MVLPTYPSVLNYLFSSTVCFIVCLLQNRPYSAFKAPELFHDTYTCMYVTGNDVSFFSDSRIDMKARGTRDLIASSSSEAHSI